MIPSFQRSLTPVLSPRDRSFQPQGSPVTLSLLGQVIWLFIEKLLASGAVWVNELSPILATPQQARCHQPHCSHRVPCLAYLKSCPGWPISGQCSGMRRSCLPRKGCSPRIVLRSTVGEGKRASETVGDEWCCFPKRRKPLSFKGP